MFTRRAKSSRVHLAFLYLVKNANHLWTTAFTLKHNTTTIVASVLDDHFNSAEVNCGCHLYLCFLTAPDSNCAFLRLHLRTLAFSAPLSMK